MSKQDLQILIKNKKKKPNKQIKFFYNRFYWDGLKSYKENFGYAQLIALKFKTLS